MNERYDLKRDMDNDAMGDDKDYPTIGELEKRRQYEEGHAVVRGGDDFGEQEPTDKPAATQPDLRQLLIDAMHIINTEVSEQGKRGWANTLAKIRSVLEYPAKDEQQPERLAAPATEPEKQHCGCGEYYDRTLEECPECGVFNQRRLHVGITLSPERYNELIAAPPLAAFKALAFPDDLTSASTFGEHVAAKVQKMLSDKYTNSHLIVAGIIDQELRAAIAEAEKGVER